MSIWHWVLVLVVVALLFGGRGKLSGLMGDAAKGIKAFKEGLKDEDKTDTASGGTLPPEKAARERDEVKS
jgi:sec-independent protein translocase protein TatA